MPDTLVIEWDRDQLIAATGSTSGSIVKLKSAVTVSRQNGELLPAEVGEELRKALSTEGIAATEAIVVLPRELVTFNRVELPNLSDACDYADVPDSVARSLAIFQLGESGGGTVVSQARDSRLDTGGPTYAQALDLLVAEEHRHAELLAICVRKLGGTLVVRNWTASLFVFARRIMGLRAKILVLLAAEVIGISYYHLLASRLRWSPVKRILLKIVHDERSHLRFHGEFLRLEIYSPWRRFLFRLCWRLTMLAAGVAVLIDHRAALRDLRVPLKTVWRRWVMCSRRIERLIVDGQPIRKRGLEKIRLTEPTC